MVPTSGRCFDLPVDQSRLQLSWNLDFEEQLQTLLASGGQILPVPSLGAEPALPAVSSHVRSLVFMDSVTELGHRNKLHHASERGISSSKNSNTSFFLPPWLELGTQPSS